MTTAPINPPVTPARIIAARFGHAGCDAAELPASSVPLTLKLPPMSLSL
jgi:hypothetical protein